MGGTILEERVVTLAGSTNVATRKQLEEIVIGAGFTPVVRDTYWNLRPGMALASASLAWAAVPVPGCGRATTP